MHAGVPTIDILGIQVACLTRSDALTEITNLVSAPHPATVAFVNTHSLNLAWRDTAYRRLLADSDLVLNDGAGLAIAARMAGRRFPANLNGTDLTPEILELGAARNWSVFLVGGRAGVAEKAADRFREHLPDLLIAGTHHGFSPRDRDAAVAAEIRASGATIVLVGMGNPLQEQWLDRNLERTGARLGLGVGALLDFTAGEVRRAPSWMNRLGIEWAFRLAQEPARLWRRYLVGNALFLARLVRYRVRRR